jgi:uncharacterized circularly permuted ATP-grasp superfamily protein
VPDPPIAYHPDLAFDEVVGPDGSLRPAGRTLVPAMAEMDPAVLRRQAARIDRLLETRGVVFSHAGEERVLSLDPLPRPILADEWELVDSGVRQRVRALERFLEDVYGPAEVIRDGVVPRQVVLSARHFSRVAHGWRPAGGVRIHVAGVDLVRDRHGRFLVLEDNVRTPSGAAYVLENRRVMAEVHPRLLAAAGVRPVSDYPARLLRALWAVAPIGRPDPTVVLLTPGVHNPAYFEHAQLARLMGIPLVEGEDLRFHNRRIWLRRVDGLAPVDVVYRRLDDDYLDPLSGRADSLLGCPGLALAARLGTVTVANAIGNGVADDKLVYTYVPDLIRYYLGEEPKLPNAPTYRLIDPDERATALGRLDELVIKPTDGAGGHGIVFGPTASRAQLAAARRAIEADPRAWIAQEVIDLSTVPTVTDTGLAPRHVDLRPFAIQDGTDVWVLPGGLTRVALRADSLLVNSSQGGGAKDTWVVTGPQPTRDSLPRPRDVTVPASAAPVVRSEGGFLSTAPLQDQAGPPPGGLPTVGEERGRRRPATGSSRGRLAGRTPEPPPPSRAGGARDRELRC